MLNTQRIPSSLIRANGSTNDNDDERGHCFFLSNLDRCSGSALYSLGDNIVQCSIFGPLQTKEDSTMIKKVLTIMLNPLGKINNTMKG